MRCHFAPLDRERASEWNEGEGGTLANRRADLRTRRAVRAPRARHTDDDTRGSQLREIRQELKRVGGRPPQRMINLAGIHHPSQPLALSGGALHRQQQRQQLRLVGRAGVLTQRLSERQVLRLRVRRQPRRIRGQKRERRRSIRPVLGEVEVNAADQSPGRTLLREKILRRLVGLRELGVKRRVELGKFRVLSGFLLVAPGAASRVRVGR